MRSPRITTKSCPRSPQLEKACAQQRRPNTAKNKINKINKFIKKKEDITFVNINAPNIGASRYIKQILKYIKGETDNNKIMIVYFNTPLTSMNISSRQKINKETVVINDTIDQLTLIDIYRTFHPKTEKYTFFSSAYGTFLRTDQMLGHKKVSQI